MLVEREGLLTSMLSSRGAPRTREGGADSKSTPLATKSMARSTYAVPKKTDLAAEDEFFVHGLCDDFGHRCPIGGIATFRHRARRDVTQAKLAVRVINTRQKPLHNESTSLNPRCDRRLAC